ncbi:hypothetical protein [Caballeronia sp. LjRoot31]|uniref:hypothetical protein n=1 Tax=Caballeronia sp. LjRoot31 TaxID=3342324 RepID=UPI003F50A0BD
MDLYLPALPAFGSALHADPGTIELTISGYLIGFSLGPPVLGPFRDRHGRRMPIASELVPFISGSAACRNLDERMHSFSFAGCEWPSLLPGFRTHP